MRCYFHGAKWLLMMTGNNVTTVFFNRKEVKVNRG
jgi:hypothetical protein